MRNSHRVDLLRLLRAACRGSRGDVLKVFGPIAGPPRGADLEVIEMRSPVLLYVNLAVACGRPASGGAAAVRKSEGRLGVLGDVICHASAHTREHSSIPPD